MLATIARAFSCAAFVPQSGNWRSTSPMSVLDAAADGAPHFVTLARHFAARSGERAAEPLFGRLDMPVGEIRVHQGHQLLPRLGAGDRARQVLDRLDARLLGGLRQQRVARREVRVEAPVREARLPHHVGDADALVAVLADGARARRAGCARASAPSWNLP